MDDPYLEENTVKEQVRDLARKAYKDHIIKTRTPHMILIQRPESSIFLVQFVDLIGALGLWGDIDTAVFAHAPGKATLEGKIRWIAQSSERYIAEKWGIGMGFDHSQWDAKEARENLQEAVRGIELDRDEPLTDRQRDALEAAEYACECGDENDYYLRLSELIPDDYGYLGRVVRPRVVYAHEACKACIRLLDTVDAETCSED